MPRTNPPKIQFLRDLMPAETPENTLQAEEARLLEYVALVRRIALRIKYERNSPGGAKPDSTQCDSDSML